MLLRLLRPIAASGIRRAGRPKIGKWSFLNSIALGDRKSLKPVSDIELGGNTGRHLSGGGSHARDVSLNAKTLVSSWYRRDEWIGLAAEQMMLRADAILKAAEQQTAGADA